MVAYELMYINKASHQCHISGTKKLPPEKLLTVLNTIVYI